VKKEADSNAMTECSHDNKPTVGMFGLSIQFALSDVCQCQRL